MRPLKSPQASIMAAAIVVAGADQDGQDVRCVFTVRDEFDTRGPAQGDPGAESSIKTRAGSAVLDWLVRVDMECCCCRANARCRCSKLGLVMLGVVTEQRPVACGVDDGGMRRTAAVHR